MPIDDSDHVDELRTEGLAELKLGRYRRARRTLEKALAAKPESRRLRHDLGPRRAYRRSRRGGAAAEGACSARDGQLRLRQGAALLREAVWKHQGGSKECISDKTVERDEGYLYFIDLNGDLARLSDPQKRAPETNALFRPGTQVSADEQAD